MKYFNRVNGNEVSQLMSWEGLVPCGPFWEEGSSLAQSCGQRFLPTAGVGLGDCTAAQENIWAASAWLAVASLWLDLEVHRSFAAVCGHSHPPWDEGAAQQLWAGLGASLVSLILCSSLNPCVPAACAVCHQAASRTGASCEAWGSTAPYGHSLQSIGPFSFTSSDME